MVEPAAGAAAVVVRGGVLTTVPRWVLLAFAGPFTLLAPTAVQVWWLGAVFLLLVLDRQTVPSRQETHR